MATKLDLRIPKAFVGYGHNIKTGAFFTKICPKCEDWRRAVAECGMKQFRYFLCQDHCNELMKRTLGEKP